MSEFRKFETGATRDTDNGKHDPEGFLHPLVIDAFNEFMHKNRVQKDGSLRDSDNWQKGIPLSAYMKSLWRHFHSVWLHHRGYGHKAKEPLIEALCAIMFNTMGYMLETIKTQEKQLQQAAGGSDFSSEASSPSVGRSQVSQPTFRQEQMLLLEKSLTR